jgi:hypothetical protein
MEILSLVEGYLRLCVDFGGLIALCMFMRSLNRKMSRDRRLRAKNHAQVMAQLEPIPRVAGQVGELHARMAEAAKT